jgi:hypothetical protein
MTDSAKTGQEAEPMNDTSELPIEDEIATLLEADHPQSERQLFYIAVAAKVLPPNENGWGILVLLLDTLRRNGRIPEGWITARSTRT